MSTCPTMPIKYFSIPQCFRYERMTRGRRREHYQWNMDIWGIKGIWAEAELLSAMVSFFKSVGVTSEDVGINVNSRALVCSVMTSLSVPDSKLTKACVLVDKMDKLPMDVLKTEFEDIGIAGEVAEELAEVLKSKDLSKIESLVGKDSEAVSELNQLFSLLDLYGLKDWVSFDSSVVRGLSYYTGVVFEAFDRKGELRAIAGGGRYDKLHESFGGDSTPAVGFGFGDAVITELLKDRGLLPDCERNSVDYMVFGINEDDAAKVIDISSRLRSAGRSVDTVLEKKKVKWVFKHADRCGAKSVIIVGGSEWEQGKVAVKDMESGEQKEVPVDQLGELP